MKRKKRRLAKEKNLFTNEYPSMNREELQRSFSFIIKTLKIS